MPLNRKQTLTVVVVPLGIFVLGWLAFVVFGQLGLLLPPVLIGVFLAYLIVELRHYQMGLFIRQLDESRAQFAQTEAISSLIWTLGPSAPLPATRGWAASPDLLRELVNQVLLQPPDLVLEASSGVSTLVLAYALEKNGRGHVFALEHDPEYATRTRNMIKMHGLEGRATVIYAPLIAHTVAGVSASWYDLSDLPKELVIDLLVVDGPPDTTQPLARYPAVPLLFELFGKDVRVILDDGARNDERRTAERWAVEHNAVGKTYWPLEKGAWLLRFSGPAR